MQRKLLRLPDVRRIVGLSRSEIYRRIALKQFPASVPLGDRIRAWDSIAIAQYVEERIAAREDVKPPLKVDGSQHERS